MRSFTTHAIWFIVCLFVAFAFAGHSYGQTCPSGYQNWNGLEWQLGASVKGYEFMSASQAPSSKLGGTVKFWGKITNVESGVDSCTITMSLYNAKSGGPCEPFEFGGPLVLKYLAGNASALVAEGEGQGGLPVWGLFYFSSKESSKGTKGKLATLGAYQYGPGDPEAFQAGGINIKGTTKELQCTPSG